MSSAAKITASERRTISITIPPELSRYRRHVPRTCGKHHPYPCTVQLRLGWWSWRDLFEGVDVNGFRVRVTPLDGAVLHELAEAFFERERAGLARDGGFL